MQITITGTNEVKTLSITDNNGIEWTQDLIGNVDAMNEGEYYYWTNQIAEIEQANKLLAEFTGEDLDNIKSMVNVPPADGAYLNQVEWAIADYRQTNNL